MINSITILAEQNNNGFEEPLSKKIKLTESVNQTSANVKKNYITNSMQDTNSNSLVKIYFRKDLINNTIYIS